ncbi:MAG: hypothetical protein ACLFR1_07050 [Spirochaetia bacterium]
MTNSEKLEGYMINLSLSYENVDETTWVITDEEKGIENLIVMAEDPLIVLRIKVMDVPGEKNEEFFEQLLTLNASDMVHGAYALEGGNVVILDTLEGDTMDLEEFQASLDAISLALAQHYPVLSKYRNK